MDTWRLAKLLPKNVQGRLIQEGKVKPSLDNKALFEALVPRDKRLAVQLHRAFDDPRATAAWLYSDEVCNLLCKGELGESLVSLAQITLMVHAKSTEGKGQSKKATT